MSKKEKPTLVLIDAHAIIHRAYHALPDLTTASGEPAGALYGLSTMLVSLIRELKPEYIVAAYDLAGPTHRHEAYKEYKGTRAKTDDALVSQFDTSRDIFEAFHIPTYDAEGFEADDVIGTLSKKLHKKFNIVIASGDMDTLQLVVDDAVRVFTMRKGIKDTVMYDEDAVVGRFGFKPEHISDFKGLRGDPSDNIIGIPGVGEKTATTLIQNFGTIENIYKALKKDEEKFKEKTGLTDRIVNLLKDNEEEAEFSKVLATIRDDAPVTFNEEEAEWRDSFTADNAIELFSELGFRSLVQRMKDLENGAQNKAETEKVEKEKKETIDENSPVAEEAKVLLWLTQSDVTNPTAEDVLNITKSKTLEEAHEKLSKEAKKAQVFEIYEKIEKPLIPIIKKLNETGILIDEKYLKDLSKEYHKELDKIAKKIYKAVGEEFNLNSPKQLGKALFETMGIKPARKKTTSTGQMSTKESELAKLKEEHPVIEDVLAYRELQKLLSTYIDAIPPLLADDKRLHTTFSQTGTTTGRLSSRDPNLQNIPIRSELGRRIRRAFVADKGKKLLAFDYSQIELRIVAFLSGDKKLQNIFKRNEDVHSAVASEVFDVPPEKVSYEMRRRAKVINFGILYGMGVNALRENLKTDRKEAQEYLNKYFEKFSGLADYLAKTKAEARRLGYTTTFFGRRRYFPSIKSSLPYVRAQAERMAINAPMQGTQSDIIKSAMVRINGIIESQFKNDAALVLQIHDELIFEVSNETIDDFIPKVEKAMGSVLTPKETNGVPITVSIEMGDNWGEMERI